MLDIRNRDGQVVATAESHAAAMRLVDWHTHTDRAAAPFHAVPTGQPVPVVTGPVRRPGWDVFDPRDGVPVLHRRTRRAARRDATRLGLDYAPAGYGWTRTPALIGATR